MTPLAGMKNKIKLKFRISTLCLFLTLLSIIKSVVNDDVLVMVDVLVEGLY